jgi:hypothetical protein
VGEEGEAGEEAEEEAEEEGEEAGEEEGKGEGEGAVVVILDDGVAHLKAGRLLLLFVFR